MVYVVTDSKSGGVTMLVKAENQEEVKTKLRLSEMQSISGVLTGTEMFALEYGRFTVVTV